jgi:protoporphyrinogen oxidase
MMAEQQKTWGIIGGGMLGMTLALRLSQKGYKVTILESAAKAGGLTSSWQMQDLNGEMIQWDRFYHVILMSDLNTRKILKEIGLENDLRWVETKTGFYSDGKLYSMSNLIEFYFCSIYLEHDSENVCGKKKWFKKRNVWLCNRRL